MSLLKKIKNFVLFSLLLSLCLSQPAQATQFNYYADLVGDWSEIFPDQNRNAAGPKFFKHILDKEITYQDFIEYNKLSCAVSGSLIFKVSVKPFVQIILIEIFFSPSLIP